MSLIGFQISAQVRENNRRREECSNHAPAMIAESEFWGRFICEECKWCITCDKSIAEKEGLEWKLHKDADKIIERLTPSK